MVKCRADDTASLERRERRTRARQRREAREKFRAVEEYHQIRADWMHSMVMLISTGILQPSELAAIAIDAQRISSKRLEARVLTIALIGPSLSRLG